MLGVVKANSAVFVYPGDDYRILHRPYPDSEVHLAYEAKVDSRSPALKPPQHLLFEPLRLFQAATFLRPNLPSGGAGLFNGVIFILFLPGNVTFSFMLGPPG